MAETVATGRSGTAAEVVTEQEEAGVRKRGGGPKGSTDRFSPRDLGAFGFLIPFLLAYALFMLYPVLQAAVMSFYDWDFLDITRRETIGLDNFRRMFWGTEMTWSLDRLWLLRLVMLLLLVPLFRSMRKGSIPKASAVSFAVLIVAIFGVWLGFHPGEGGRWFDSQFWLSFGNTLLFVAMSTPVIVGTGLALALALNRQGRMVGVLRAMFFAPYVLSVAVLTLIWAFLLNPGIGLVGIFGDWFGFEPINLLNSTTWAMPAIVLATLWWTVGFNLVLFLAGLQDIDQQQYEAAAIDGANRWQTFWNITVPGLKRTIRLVAVLQVIYSFQIFGQVFIMTRGGPDGATRVLIQHIFERGFRDFELGYASAMSIVLFLAIILVSVVQFVLLPKGEDEA
ncbi:MAG: sugar ABC transporter permease [Egibacteraceae bacterium]